MKRFLPAVILLTMISLNADAQSLSYGRNKIQYTDFDWRVLETEHFNIYYYPEMQEIAEIGAHAAEESFSILEGKFNYTINRRIPLIFYSSHLHFQQTNTTPYFLPEGVAGFYEFLKGRVVIPCNGNIVQFKRVIRHELVHVFMLGKLYNKQRNLNATRFKQPPLWFTEGLAEIWSGDEDSQSRMVMADQVLEGTVVPMTSIYSIMGTYLMYKEGESFLRFIEDNYGADKIRLLLENFWRDKDFNEVIRLVIGKSIHALNEEWLYSLKKRFYPAFSEQELPRMVSSRITSTGFNDAPAFYRGPDGDRLLYVANTTGYTNIVSQKLPAPGFRTEPDVLISAERTDKFEVIRIPGSRIDVNGEGNLVFASKSGETDVLYIHDIEEDKTVKQFRFDGLVMLTSPGWSNDMKRVVFAGLSESGNRDIYIVNTDTGQLQQITDGYHEEKNPSWSPDDRSIVYSSSSNEHGSSGAYNLFSYILEDGTTVQLTFGSHVDSSPVWSPDGRYIAYTSDMSGASNIYLLSVPDEIVIPEENGSQANGERASRVHAVTHFATGAFSPEWTPDGELYYTAFERYGYQIRKINLSGMETESDPVTEYIGEPVLTPGWRAEKIESISDVNTSAYTEKYSLDIAQGQVSSNPVWGTGGGAQFLFSDLLGNDNYYLLLYNNAQTKESFFRSFNFSFARYSLKKRTNIGYGLFHFAGRRYNNAEFFFSERFYGGFVNVRYPLSVFNRLEYFSSFGRSEKDWIYTDLERVALLSSNYVSYVHDNSIWGPTGPVDGSRYLISLGYIRDIQYRNVDYFSIIMDLRKYFRLTRRSAFAIRAMTLLNRGTEPQRFFIGGSWDLRGYPRWQVWGQEINFASAEYRFPFIDALGIRFPFGGIGFGSIRGAVFTDAAMVKDERHTDTRKLGSVGVGVRVNFGGLVVLRYDIGRRIEDDFSKIGSDTFTQFFFGWDF